MRLNKKRERHWRIVFKENKKGVKKKKLIIHGNMWNVYMNNKLLIVQGRYCVEFQCSYGKRVIWEVVYNCFDE